MTTPATPGSGPRAILGPFTLREVVYIAGAAIVVLAAIFSFGRHGTTLTAVLLGFLLPIAGAVAVAWRRLKGRERLDIGTFSLEQAAGLVGLGALIVSLGGLPGASMFVQFLGVVGAVAMLATTFGASLFPRFREDFDASDERPIVLRDVLPAHAGASASGAGAGSAPPAPPAASGGEARGAAAQTPPVTTGVPITATAGATAPTTPLTDAAGAPFWFAVPEARDAVDARSGAVLFRVEPGTWWLALGRGAGGLHVRHDDGRSGWMAKTDGLELG